MEIKFSHFIPVIEFLIINTIILIGLGAIGLNHQLETASGIALLGALYGNVVLFYYFGIREVVYYTWFLPRRIYNPMNQDPSQLSYPFMPRYYVPLILFYCINIPIMITLNSIGVIDQFNDMGSITQVYFLYFMIFVFYSLGIKKALKIRYFVFEKPQDRQMDYLDYPQPQRRYPLPQDYSQP